MALSRAAPLLALLMAGAASAAESPVERHLGAAMRLRAKHEGAKALVELQHAQKKSRGPADDLAIALDEGVILEELGKKKLAAERFKKALALDPTAKLPIKVSPKVQKVFEELRPRAAEAVKPPEPVIATPPPAPAPASAESPPVPPPPSPVARVDAPPRSPAPIRVALAPEPASNESTTVTRSAGVPTHHRTWALVPLIGGALAAGAGGYFLFEAKRDDDLLVGRAGPSTLSLTQADQYRKQGALDQTLGIALAGAGGAAMIAGAVLYARRVDDAPVMSVALTPRGLGLAGTF